MTAFDKVKKKLAKFYYSIDESDFYKVNICGKRFDINESGNRVPLDNYFWDQIYNQLKLVKKSDQVIVQITNKNYFEEGTIPYSESEYYGIRKRLPIIYIFTPKTHKTKFVIDGRYI